MPLPYRRYVATPRLPGFFIRNKARRYALFYHVGAGAPTRRARSAPPPRATRSACRGCKIDLRYGEQDANSVVAGHAVIDRDLREAGIGRLEHRFPESERAARVREQMTDGYLA